MGAVRVGAWCCSVLVVAALMAMGCGVELEGEEGNLTFDYIDTDLRSTPPGGDIAVGAKVDIQVKDARDDMHGDVPLELLEAYSDDAAKLDVVAMEHERFTLEAGDASGSEGTRIHAEAVGEDGEEISDSTTIESAVAESVEVDSICSPAVYVTDSEAHFNYDMRDGGDSRITGYGYYPLDVEPEEGGAINEGHSYIQTMSVNTGEESGSFELVADESEVDAFSFDFELVEPGDIEHLELSFDHEDTESTLDEGEEDLVAMFEIGADGDLICPGAESALRLESNTPDVCDVSYDFVGNLHFVRAEGLEAGQCEIELGVVDTDLEETISFEVE